MRRNWKYLVSAAALTAGLIATPATPALAYSPGTATSTKPTYNAATGNWDYHCSYAHWRSGAKVVWRCDLYVRYMEDDGSLHSERVLANEGSWTPGSTSYTTKTYHRPKITGEGAFCTESYGYSVDGYSATSIKCN
jgi:hypothetical protein